MVRRPEKWGGTGAGMGTGSIYRFFWSHIIYCDYMVKTPYLYHNYMGLFIVFFFLISLLSTGSISLF